MRKFFLLGLLFSLSYLSFSPSGASFAQNNLTFIVKPISYQFGEHITFSVEVSGTDRTSDVYLSVTQLDNQTEQTFKTQYINDDLFKITLPPTDINIRPFSTISFSFYVKTNNGTLIHSEPVTFKYTDNRFAWRVLKDNNFTVYWYKGTKSFAESIINEAIKSQREIEQIIPTSTDQNIDIYIYENQTDLQKVIQFSQSELIAGLAMPDLMTIAVAIPSDNTSSEDIARNIPHELTHIYLYTLMGKDYDNIPVWLNEGLASLMETKENLQYDSSLKNAYKTGNLLAIKDLCASYPSDPSLFLLAYAESTSFVKYLLATYKPIGIQALLASYKSDPNCENSFHKALGVTLSGAEQDWLNATFYKNDLVTIFKERLPWLFLFLALIIVPLIIFTFNNLLNKK